MFVKCSSMLYVKQYLNGTGYRLPQRFGYPSTWEKDQSSPGTQVSQSSRGRKLVACQLWLANTYVSRLLPTRQRAVVNILIY